MCVSRDRFHLMCIQVDSLYHLRADNYIFTPKANFESPIYFPPACLWTVGRSQCEPTLTQGEHENAQKKNPLNTRIQTLKATMLTTAPTH